MKIKFQFLALAALGLVILTGLTSCGDLEQHLYLKADGSGKLETTFDVGELMSMTKGLGNLGMDVDTFSDDDIVDTFPKTPEAPKDPMTLFMEKITDPTYPLAVDTLITLTDIMPDSVRQKDTRPDLSKKMSIRMVSPANSADLKIGFVMNFDNTDQLREMVEYLKTIDQQPDMMTSGPVPMEADNFLSFKSDMKAGWIKVDTILYTDIALEMGMGMQGDSAMSSEDMGLMEMMFGNSKLKTIIHIPGEVLTCSNPSALLTKDNRVIVEQSFMDVIKAGKFNGFEVTFKP